MLNNCAKNLRRNPANTLRFVLQAGLDVSQRVQHGEGTAENGRIIRLRRKKERNLLVPTAFGVGINAVSEGRWDRNPAFCIQTAVIGAVENRHGVFRAFAFPTSLPGWD